MDSESSPLRDGVILKKNEKRETKLQLLRLQRLKPFEAPFLTFRIVDYCEEAKNTFIIGCFRSCIICSAIAVELAIKHFLISISEEWEEEYWEMETGKLTFGNIIGRFQDKSKKLGSSDVAKDADWLNEARNKIVAHPLYIGNTFDVKEPARVELEEFEHVMWASKTMLRDITKILQLVEPAAAKAAFEERKVAIKKVNGKILEEFSVIDFLKQRKPIRYEPADFLLWKTIQNELIEEIAYQAYKRMASIINSLSPRNDTHR